MAGLVPAAAGANTLSSVMAGLVPAIHVLLAAKTWMPGTSPGMTSFFTNGAF
jgi:hypothetical protein